MTKHDSEVTASLKQLREIMGEGLTQRDMAARLDRNQSNVARIEGLRETANIGTIRAYLGALGLELEMYATDGNRRFKLAF